MRCFMFAMVVIGVLGTTALGQTTRPAMEDWPGVAERVVAAAVSGDGAGALADDIPVMGLDGKASNSARLLARVKGGTLITVRSYRTIPGTLAADLAEDIKDAELPDEVKRPLMLRDGRHVDESNAVAASWVVEALGAVPADSVAVAVIALPLAGDEGGVELLFVLMRGREMRVSGVAFGAMSEP